MRVWQGPIEALDVGRERWTRILLEASSKRRVLRNDIQRSIGIKIPIECLLIACSTNHNLHHRSLSSICVCRTGAWKHALLQR